MNNFKRNSEPKNTNPLDFYQLSTNKIIAIKKSEEDIKQGRIISQEELDKEDLEWLSEI